MQPSVANGCVRVVLGSVEAGVSTASGVAAGPDRPAQIANQGAGSEARMFLVKSLHKLAAI